MKSTFFPEITSYSQTEQFFFVTSGLTHEVKCFRVGSYGHSAGSFILTVLNQVTQVKGRPLVATCFLVQDSVLRNENYKNGAIVQVSFLLFFQRWFCFLWLLLLLTTGCCARHVIVQITNTDWSTLPVDSQPLPFGYWKQALSFHLLSKKAALTTIILDILSQVHDPSNNCQRIASEPIIL